MKNLDALGFKFKVGEIVYHRLNHPKRTLISDADGKKEVERTKVLIIERVAHECSGGIQLFYLVRVSITGQFATFDPKEFYRMHELELEP